ncbi:hypothetical protein SAMD00019534_028440 [Acytostelium subglobosum LB1]|uniref:hypothetical protein n=1 Tax=Acytostelium subglobosum LB1 TaxID=1410327 RepID=UPI00064507FB|nr:hypothetical protein SAMD00019534_028440 [Acytostelium subglobosum LB1]GAM19669.1 hypothetical protein SAMD00019534_028440 [Acytostelium subglobosum LB1]|eukprot:XP_012756431.1 hypothetical protein SAMD00019534_028440 [Acytostelium subglobosum LB1]
MLLKNTLLLFLLLFNISSMLIQPIYSQEPIQTQPNPDTPPVRGVPIPVPIPPSQSPSDPSQTFHFQDKSFNGLVESIIPARFRDIRPLDREIKFYLAPDGIDDPKCGSTVETPCFSFKGVANQTLYMTILSNITITMAPGLYNYTDQNYAEFFLQVISIVGTRNEKGSTIIILPSSGSWLRLVFTTAFVSNITLDGTYSWPIITQYNDGSNLVESYNNVPAYIKLFYTSVSIDRLIVTNNTFLYLFQIYDSYATVTNSIFKGNKISTIFLSFASRVVMTHNRFVMNKAVSLIYSFDTRMFIYKSLFISNTITYGITGVYNSLYISTCRFHNNYSTFSLLIMARNVEFRAYYSIFQSNTAIISGIALLSDDTYSSFTGCIFDSNFGTESNMFGTSSWLLVEHSIIQNNVMRASSLFSASSNSFTMVMDCVAVNNSASIITSDSNTVVVIMESWFKRIQGRIVESYGNGPVFIMNCRFMSCRTTDSLIIIENSSTMRVHHSDFIKCMSATTIFLDNMAELFVSQTTFANNTYKNALIEARNRYNITLSQTSFNNNTGTFVAGVLKLDQTGSLTMTRSFVTNNTSPYGAMVYYMNPKRWNDTVCTNYFANNDISGNMVSFAGAITFYTQDILCEYDCINCTTSKNHADHGDDVNTNYYNFSANLPRHFETPQTFTVSIISYDAFGNTLRGYNDITYRVYHSCPNVRLEGITMASATKMGIQQLGQLELSGPPGSQCNLTFTSDPPPATGDFVCLIYFKQCPPGTQPFVVGGVYHCLKLSKIPKHLVNIMFILIFLEMALVIACIIMIIIFWNNKIIRYSNRAFLLIILFSALLLQSSIFPLYFVNSVTCKLRIIILPLAMSTITCSVIAKNIRIYRIRKELNFQTESLVKTSNFLRNLALLMLGPLLLVILNVVLSSNNERLVFRPKEAAHLCENNSAYIYIVINLAYLEILLFACCVLIYKSREFHSSPGTFSEPVYIAILVYNYLIILGILIPLRFSLQSNQTAQFLIPTISILLFVLVTLLVLYLPKFYFLFRGKAVVVSVGTHYTLDQVVKPVEN